MKRILLSVLAAAVFTTAMQAQESKGREPGKHRKMERHYRGGHDFKSLNLSDDQKAKLKALHEENRKQMAELRKNENITVKEWKEKMQAQRKDHQAKVQSLLTADQKAQLEKSRSERKAKMQERSKARGERMKANLGLTDEQSAKLKSNREAMAGKMKAIREDKALSAEAKKTQMMELRKQQQEEMKSILTEEQLQKMKEQRKQRPSRKKI